jgi:hypothetical protein
MKTQIISRISGCLLSILFASSSFAQSNYIALSPIAISGVNLKVSEKIQTGFYKSFTGAENVKWYEQDKKILATFSMNEMNHRTLLSKKGVVIYHISYGSEKNLPAEVRKIVKSTYFDYKITMAVKVEEKNRAIWVVDMEDDKTLITVRVEDNEMEEVRKLQKS